MVVNRGQPERPAASPDSFFRATASGFEATELTRGPWDPDSQHAGPPAALLARAVELCPGLGDDDRGPLVGRITYEILRPVPITELRVEVAVERPGRRVDMVAASLLTAAGEELVRARAWRLRDRRVELPAGLSGVERGSPARAAGRPSGREGPPTPPGELAATETFFATGFDVGYHAGMEYRFETGGFDEQGPAVCWMRMLAPLIAGEEPSPLQRVLIAADSGNGISSTLDFERYMFINVDLSVHLHRMPATEWVCLDAITVPERNGVGLSDTMIWDERGPLGRACQTLLVAER